MSPDRFSAGDDWPQWKAQDDRHCRQRLRAAMMEGQWPQMNLSEPFIHRPIATALLMAAVAFVGIAAFPFLPVASLPQIDLPTIQVTASMSGASAETMAVSVATPLERQRRLANVSSDLLARSRQLNFTINRDQSSRFGISARRSMTHSTMPTVSAKL